MEEKQDYLEIKNPIISENEIKQFVFERFFEVKKTHKIKNLVKFQAMNKYMIMAHDPEELKKLGKMVASYKKNLLSEILEYYEEHLEKSLENQPTIKKHSNVILHVYGHFSKDLIYHEKKILLDLLQEYRKEKLSLGKILAEIHPIIFRFDKTYLASQTYFLLYSNVDSRISFNI